MMGRSFVFAAIYLAFFLTSFASQVAAGQPSLDMAHCRNGNIAQLRKFVKQGGDLSPMYWEYTGTGYVGRYCLTEAAREDQLEAVKYLISVGVRIDATTEIGHDQSALDLAANLENIEMAEALISAGIKVNTTAVEGGDGLAPIHRAALRGNVAIAELLLRNGADVRLKSHTTNPYPTYSRFTEPIHVAAHAGKVAMVDYLLRHGAAIEVLDGDSRSPLHYGARSGNVEVVKSLVSAGANVDSVDGVGLTPLLVSIEPRDFHPGFPEVAEQLLKSGASPNWEPDGTSGRAPLMAVVTGYDDKPEFAKLLIEHGALVNAYHSDKRKEILWWLTPSLVAPIHGVAKNCHVKTLEVLLAAGADVNLPAQAMNSDGSVAWTKTALAIAESNGCDPVVEILQKAGAH